MFHTPEMPKQALSQLPVDKAIVRVLVHFLQEIECRYRIRLNSAQTG